MISLYFRSSSRPIAALVSAASLPTVAIFHPAAFFLQPWRDDFKVETEISEILKECRIVHTQ
jgi:hypothetical protein